MTVMLKKRRKDADTVAKHYTGVDAHASLFDAIQDLEHNIDWLPDGKLPDELATYVEQLCSAADAIGAYCLERERAGEEPLGWSAFHSDRNQPALFQNSQKSQQPSYG